MIFIVACVAVWSCDSGTRAGADGASDTTEHIVTTHATPVTSLKVVEDWVGKTAREAGFFEDSVLQQRLRDLLGKEYPYFRENWNVQTPIVREDQIYTASGCKQHDCASYNSVVYFDVENNNLNVLIVRGAQYKIFTEKGLMNLPKNLKEEQKIIIENG